MWLPSTTTLGQSKSETVTADKSCDEKMWLSHVCIHFLEQPRLASRAVLADVRYQSQPENHHYHKSETAATGRAARKPGIVSIDGYDGK